MTISIRSVQKTFGRFPALSDVSLDIADGELLALLGPSGSGKTTLLRAIAGLEYPDRGQILIDDEDVTFIAAARRRVGLVFQQYALFRHMTVAGNVAFGLDVRKGGDRPSKAEIQARVDALIRLVELEGLDRRYPDQLSGGQRQGVALARALAVSPRVLLLDEPFGALDATVRKSLRKELRRIHDATGVATVFVTHDQEEALELADRVAILNAGVVEQVGAPADVRDAPVNAFVCGFVGVANRIEGVARNGRFVAGPTALAAAGLAAGPAVAFLRPYDIVLHDEGVDATVQRVGVDGAIATVEFTVSDGRRLEAQLSREQGRDLKAGAVVRALPRHAHVYSVV